MNLSLITTRKSQIPIIFLFWILITVISSIQLYLRFKGLYEGGWMNMFIRQLPVWIPWAILTPLIFLFVDYIDKVRVSRLMFWMANLINVVVIILGYSILASILSLVIYQSGNSYLEILINNLLIGIASNLIIYIMITVFGYAFIWYKQYKASEAEKMELNLKNAKLTMKLKDAQLKSLRMQLHPHFLFNTLNSIASLIRIKNNKLAVGIMVKLSELLRYTIYNNTDDFIQLEKEIALMNKYLSIEKVRFDEKLMVIWDIDPKSINAKVPSMILQPFIENSLKHGFSDFDDSCRLQIKSEVNHGQLILLIEDNGSGLPLDWNINDNKGVGISNTKERLQEIYEENSKLDIKRLSKGVVVEIIIPFEEIKTVKEEIDFHEA